MKYLHHEAKVFDIGIYFEANGHGTVLFKPSLLQRLQDMEEQVGATCSDRYAIGSVCVCGGGHTLAALHSYQGPKAKLVSCISGGQPVGSLQLCALYWPKVLACTVKPVSACVYGTLCCPFTSIICLFVPCACADVCAAAVGCESVDESGCG